jgi:hypothetical protein
MAETSPEALDALENLLNAVWLDEDNGVLCHRALAAIRALRAAPVAMREMAAFQDRVQPWMNACFGAEISGDRLERGDRLLEEVLELLQSGDYPPERVAALVSYVWNRPKGEPAQEVGGVMVTLAAYCLAHGLDMHDAAETELARIWTKVEKIRAKQAAKPTGSALPVALPLDAPAPVDPVAEAARVLLPYLRWTIGPESPGHHPTLPSAIAALERALAQEARHEG